MYLDSDAAKTATTANEGETMTDLDLAYAIRDAIRNGDLPSLRDAITRLQRIAMLFEHEESHDNVHEDCPACQRVWEA
jgi:hypothetical protein